jgi:hypothetical protein
VKPDERDGRVDILGLIQFWGVEQWITLPSADFGAAGRSHAEGINLFTVISWSAKVFMYLYEDKQDRA